MNKRLIAILSCIAFFLLGGNGAPLAQELGYIEVFQKLLEQWDRGTLTFDKKDLRPVFEKKIGGRITTKLFGYEDQTWAKAAYNYWDERLPAKLTPGLKLSTNGRLILMGVYAENLLRYAKFTPLSSAEGDLKTSLFITLSRAQTSASAAKRELIDVEDMLRSITAPAPAQTQEWPTCLRRNP